MASPRTYRIFVSSPSDVFGERERVDRVLARLNGELGGGARLEAIRWEQTFYTADRTFQDQIVPPSETDLVICILWKRLGATLPVAYQRPDGTTPTGTEYEFEDAMEAARSKGTPDVIVYRKSAAVLLDAERFDQEKAQFEALKQFWSRWFQNESGHFIAAFESFESTDQFEVMLEAHVRQWLARNEADLSARITWPIALRGSPFRGLQAFDLAHADVFFGRRRVIERLRERLGDAALRGTPFLLLLGMSGTGKSSVVRAGLVPRLTQIGAVPGVDFWRSCVMRPAEGGGEPLLALARALYRPDVLPELAAGDNPAPADSAALLRHAPAAAARAVRLALGRAGAAIAEREAFDRPVAARLLLVVDQFEEALAGAPEEREAFGAALGALIEAGDCWVVGTLRSDLYAAFQASPSLVGLRERGATFDLLPPGPAEMAEIVTGPAEAAGLRFEARPGTASLDERLIEDAAGAGSLPLLQLALDELFAARDPETNTLSFAAYDDFGGLAGVVERRAEQAFSGLDAEAAAAFPAMLGALVHVAEDGVVTSRTTPVAPLVQVAPGAQRAIDAFVAARLLLVDDADGTPMLRVAHEALVTAWPRARTMIAAERDALRVRGRIEDAARRWLIEGRHADFLLPAGRPLAEAAELAETRPVLLSPDMAALIAASVDADAARQAAAKAASERELRLQGEAAEARAQGAIALVRRTRIAVGVVGVVALLALGAAGLAWFEGNEAQRREVLAEGNFGSALKLATELSTGATLFSQQDFGGATKAYRTGLDIVQQILKRDPDAGAWYALGRTDAFLHRSIGQVMVQSGDTQGGNAELLDSLARFQKVGLIAPPEINADDDVVGTEQVIASDLFLQGDPAGAVSHLKNADAVAVTSLAKSPQSVDATAKLTSAHKLLGDMLSQTGDQQGALAAYQAGQAVAESFGATHPDDPQWQRAAADNEQGAAYTLRKLGDKDKSLALDQGALKSYLALLAKTPDDGDLQHAAINTEQSVALGLELVGDNATALTHASAALVRAKALLDKNPSVSRWLLDVALSETYVGSVLKMLGRDAEAKPHLDNATSLMAKVTGS